MDQQQTAIIVIAFPTVLTVAGFLFKAMLGKTESSIRDIAADVKAAVATLAVHDGRHQVAEIRLDRLESELDMGRKDRHDLRNALQALSARFDMVARRLEERDQ